MIVYSYVTALARLKMLESVRWLLSLGCTLFYQVRLCEFRAGMIGLRPCFNSQDTDAVIVKVPLDKLPMVRERFRINSSAYGAWKEETSTPIASFVSLGPKNYSLITRGRDEAPKIAKETVVKARGFTLRNAVAKEALNHKTMRTMLLDFLKNKTREVTIKSWRPKYDRNDQKLVSTVITKKYTNRTYDKRMVFPDRCGKYVATVPFGAKSLKYTDTTGFYFSVLTHTQII